MSPFPLLLSQAESNPMSTSREAPTGFSKTVWQREYMRQCLKDPEYRDKFNEYQRAYHKAKRASDPEYCARRKASKQKYLSKLQELN